MMNLKLLCLVLCVPFIKSQDFVNALAGESKIIGGTNIEISDAPFLAAIQNGQTLLCSAVQISSNWLTSTAKCIQDIIKKKLRAHVRAGTWNLADGFIYHIRHKRFHPRFNNATLAFNIGLVQLRGRGIVPNKNMKPIEMLNSNVPVKRDGIVLIYGYGITSQFGLQPALRAGKALILQDSDCGYEEVTSKTPSTTFCASNTFFSVCDGDAGGAGIYGNKLAGIISSGLTCEQGDRIGFAKISSVRTWIKKLTGV